MRKDFVTEAILPQTHGSSSQTAYNKKEISVLYVDEKGQNLLAFESAWRGLFTIFTAGSVRKARQILREQAISVLITEQRNEELSTAVLSVEALSSYPGPIKILISEDAAVASIANAIQEGYIFKYLDKPWNVAFLREAIEDAHKLYLSKVDMLQREKTLTEMKFKLERALEEVLKEKMGLGEDSIN